jgi:hypothetical protein
VADSLEAAVLVLEADGQAKPAARLLGVCRSLREILGEPAEEFRALSALVRSCRERLVDTLGSASKTEQEAIGRAMTVDDAISFALMSLSSEVSIAGSVDDGDPVVKLPRRRA